MNIIDAVARQNREFLEGLLAADSAVLNGIPSTNAKQLSDYLRTADGKIDSSNLILSSEAQDAALESFVENMRGYRKANIGQWKYEGIRLKEEMVRALAKRNFNVEMLADDTRQQVEDVNAAFRAKGCSIEDIKRSSSLRSASRRSLYSAFKKRFELEGEKISANLETGIERFWKIGNHLFAIEIVFPGISSDVQVAFNCRIESGDDSQYGVTILEKLGLNEFDLVESGFEVGCASLTASLLGRWIPEISGDRQ